MKLSLSSPQFQLVLQQSKSLTVNGLHFRFLPSKKNLIGFAINKKLGQAIQRNLFKRRCRAIFVNRLKNRPAFFLIVSPKKPLNQIDNIDESFQQFEQRVCA